VRRLAEVADYFRRHEPSSPVPLLIDRVKELVGKNFLTLVEDLGLATRLCRNFASWSAIAEKAADAESSTKAEPELEPRNPNATLNMSPSELRTSPKKQRQALARVDPLRNGSGASYQKRLAPASHLSPQQPVQAPPAGARASAGTKAGSPALT